MLVVDDALLLNVLADRDPELRAAAIRGELYTTWCWYYRLATAVHSPTVTGALSQPLTGLSSDAVANVLADLDQLPRRSGC